MTIVDVLILTAAALAVLTVAGVITLAYGAAGKHSVGVLRVLDHTRTRVPTRS